MIDFCGQNSFLESYKFTSWDYESVYWSLLIVLTFLSLTKPLLTDLPDSGPVIEGAAPRYHHGDHHCH